MRFLPSLLLLSAIVGCSTGEGEGQVSSERLYVNGCWNGPFSLEPTFFGANPGFRNQLAVRIQRGDNNAEVSDGLSVVLTDLDGIRGSQLGKPVPVGLPRGVSPSGIPIKLQAHPPTVSLALLLHDTCHTQNGALYAIDGQITFDKLFSGDPNESNGDERLTDASFSARFADPRSVKFDGTYDDEQVSEVKGWFHFYFQRGQPAQPFP